MEMCNCHMPTCPKCRKSCRQCRSNQHYLEDYLKRGATAALKIKSIETSVTEWSCGCLILRTLEGNIVGLNKCANHGISGGGCDLWAGKGAYRHYEGVLEHVLRIGHIIKSS